MRCNTKSEDIRNVQLLPKPKYVIIIRTFKVVCRISFNYGVLLFFFSLPLSVRGAVFKQNPNLFANRAKNLF